MHNGRERINGFTVNEQIQLHQFRRPVTGVLVIHRTVAARDALNLVVEIDQNFVERQFAMQHHATRVQRFGAFHLPALLQNQLQDVTDVFIRAKHVRPYNWLPDLGDQARVGKMRRIIDQEFLAACC